MSDNESVRSCFNCPSYLGVSQASDFFNKSVGTPVCARFGKPIGNMNSSVTNQHKIAKAVAKNCDAYGEERPAVPNWFEASFSVMFPDPSRVDHDREPDEACTACNMCKHFVREDVVTEELGFASGLCSAKGRLVLSNRYAFTARECEFRQLGSVRTDVSGITWLPEYESDFEQTGDATKDYFARKASNEADPTEYETDRDVTTEESARGIRAWRAVQDPHTENIVYLPIYRLDFFDDDERSKIPRTGDDEHPEDYVDHSYFLYKIAVLWGELNETPGLWGQSGTGKTELARHLAWLMCLPFERFSITGSTELEDLAGKMHFNQERGTYWEDGRLTKAWRKPCVIVVDEPNTGPPDVWQFLRPLTDNSKQLVLDMNAGERVERHNETYLIMAMNPAWDAKNVGANMISDADANRLMHMYVELPDPKLEREIITARCKHDGYEISKQTLDTIMDIASDIRDLCENDTLPITWAIRPQLKVARASKWFDLMTAYRMASADFLEPDVQQQLLNVVRSHEDNSDVPF